MRRAITYLQSMHRLYGNEITIESIYLVSGIVPKKEVSSVPTSHSAGKIPVFPVAQKQAAPVKTSPSQTQLATAPAKVARELPKTRTQTTPIQPTAASAKFKAKATFDYDAEEENELGFKEGDIVTVTKKDASGWWEGECNGKSGMFPANYVEVIEGPAVKAVVPAVQKERKCVAVFDFTADSDDELTIKEGEVITINSEAEGWILGTNSKGMQGLFPANYVSVVK